jgi:3-methyladenine DNA glycosylase AlkD
MCAEPATWSDHVNYEEVVSQLQSLANPEAVAGMARYGINPSSAYGVSIPNLRKIAAKAGKHHLLAGALWESGIHEARILASMVEDPRKLTEEQMDRWVKDFNSWDLCDQCCNNLFRKWPHAHDKAMAWSAREEEFIRRAGFVLMACLAVHDKQAPDKQFLRYLPEILRASVDRRNFVKKAVNWALRQIGKRNHHLNAAAIEAAEQMRELDSPPAKWIAADAIRELAGDAVQKRLRAGNGRD